MPLDDGELMKLAEAVADGFRIDWIDAESSSDDADQRELIRQLRVLADLAVAYRSSPGLPLVQQAASVAGNWGSLEIRSELGHGIFGTVYLAADRLLDREVALKILHSPNDDVAYRVVKEARVLAQLRHPNVVTIFGADRLGEQVGLWMEYIHGRTLKDILQAEGPFSAREATLIGVDLCHALAAVHRAGFLHQDVKAQNVMRETGGRIVLMDFGAADALHPETADRRVAGTPVYLAPEILSGASPSIRSDLYSLGVLLFYLVSGEFPVGAASLSDLRDAHLQRRQWLRDLRPDLPAPFVNVIDNATAAEPGDRPESAGALEALLASALGLATLHQGGSPRIAPDESLPVSTQGSVTDVRQPEQHYAITRDGVRIVYAVHGSGPPLIFVRGWISHLAFMWEDPGFRAFMEQLGESCTVYRYDTRGNGLSDRTVRKIDLETLLCDLDAVVEHVPSDEFVLYGSTFGGPIAIAYAARHPERVRKIVLEGSYASGKAIASKARQLFVINALRVFPEAAFLLLSYATNPGPDRTPYRRPELMHQMITPATAAQFYAFGFSIDVTDDAALVRAPALVLHRMESHSIPLRLGRELASLLPTARFVSLRGSAHNLWEGDAEPALKEIKPFLRAEGSLYLTT